jgi:FeS assembly SUF system regulator
MLRISKLTDYATIILSYLALEPAKMASAPHIASENTLALPTVSKILKILCEAKLLKSFRGTGGGYQLARSAKEITLADVVSALEGKLAMTECCAISNSCVLDSLCAIKENWKIINKVILNTLAGVTLHDMTHPLPAHTSLRGIPIKVQGET